MTRTSEDLQTHIAVVTGAASVVNAYERKNASMKGPLESRHTSSKRRAACSWAMQWRAANEVESVLSRCSERLTSCHASIRALLGERSRSGWTTSDRHSDLDASVRQAFFRRVARGEDITRTAATWPRPRHRGGARARRAPCTPLCGLRAAGPIARARPGAASRARPFPRAQSEATASLRA